MRQRRESRHREEKLEAAEKDEVQRDEEKFRQKKYLSM